MKVKLNWFCLGREKGEIVDVDDATGEQMIARGAACAVEAKPKAKRVTRNKAVKAEDLETKGGE